MGETMMIAKHYVTFLSPGTFVSETTTKEIDSWDAQKALAMSDHVMERYNAKPYAFYFTTRTRGENDFEPHESAKSPLHYIGGTHGRFFSLDEIKERNDPKDETLIWNMTTNKHDKVYQTTEGWKVSMSVPDDAVLVERNA